MTTGEYITLNIETINKVYKKGWFPPRIMKMYRAYNLFMSLDKSIPKMQRYTEVAETMKMSEQEVRKSITKMCESI